MSWKPNIIAIAPYCDGTDVGEAWCAYMWVLELSKAANVTLIAQERPGRKPLTEQLPDVTVISRFEPSWARKFERLNAMAKLSYPSFYFWAKKQIKELLNDEKTYDIGHQFSPIALRFPSPFKTFNLPYVLGPLGGSLSTPDAFKEECQSAAWYTKFRFIDQVRLAFDPLLKSSYQNASAILGVAPYVQDLIGQSQVQRFEVMSELGIQQINRRASGTRGTGLRLLHVGRGVRTKGLRDCIRALALVQDIPNVHLDVAGRGEEIEICKELATELNIEHLVTFHGQIPRSAVDELYKKADIFCFPSFREPSGSVIYEALSFGLPAIVADRGGPGFVIDDTCGFKIDVSNPEQFSQHIAGAIRTLATMPSLRRQLSRGAYEKITNIGLWPQKISKLLDLYKSILSPATSTRS
ncbi:glycosyltransferase family 4 protein [Kordiimonas sp. SCSIO 12603]|uniref:glycosyltransferase n=1 Tax=Kordiimonas sp. SCSIO 12603 TaxID=2829596 RepID=UPI002102A593|nr:glycosyltransferase [Kordiimonas sp. SCSIO 12603]UTW60180.1 glycosyltransferase family 4 protein [Kordiimonas sp. SCSIO 12603]